MVAHDDDGSVRIELGVGSGGDFAHGHKEPAGDAGGLELPGFADIQQEGRVGLAALLGKDCGCDFEFQHEFKDILIEASVARDDGPGTRGRLSREILVARELAA